MCDDSVQMRYNIRNRISRTSEGHRSISDVAGTPGRDGAKGKKTPEKNTVAAAASKDGSLGEINSADLQPSQPRALLLQERLEAFRPSAPIVKGKGGRKSIARPASTPMRCNASDLMYLGGGLHLPAGDTLELYEKMKGDIAAHAMGSSTRRLPDDGEKIEGAVDNKHVCRQLWDEINGF